MEKTVPIYFSPFTIYPLLPLKFRRTQYQSYNVCYRVGDVSISTRQLEALLAPRWRIHHLARHGPAPTPARVFRSSCRNYDRLFIKLLHQRFFGSWRDVSGDDQVQETIHDLRL